MPTKQRDELFKKQIEELCDHKERIILCAKYLKEKFGSHLAWLKPKVVIILGSGLGPLANVVTDKKSILYKKIPFFPNSTAPGHEGRLIIGKIGGVPVFVMSGRTHGYEGVSAKEITSPLRVFHLLGVRNLIVTNACGGIADNLKLGDIMVIKNHNGLLMRDNPLTGANDENFGPRFPGRLYPYDQKWQTLFHEMTEKMKLKIKNGVFAAVPGPNYETYEELIFLRKNGVSGIGMSTVYEAIVATHQNWRILGISIVTDCPLDQKTDVTSDEVIKVANKTGRTLKKLLVKFIKKADF
jgi:purine-nucleoside phosphorylase